MKRRFSLSRASMSFVLAVVVATVFTLQSFAAPEVNKPATEPIMADDCAGTLTVTSGSATINGNSAQTGATVMSGSVIATSSNGRAMVDLGALGRVELGEGTTTTLTCVAGSLHIKSTCGIKIEVRRGTVDVKSPKTETLVVGNERKYDESFEATATGGVDAKIECGDHTGGAFVRPGLLGLLALIGLGAGVATGVGLGGDNPTPSSPIR